MSLVWLPFVNCKMWNRKEGIFKATSKQSLKSLYNQLNLNRCLRSSLFWFPNHVVDLNLSAFVCGFMLNDSNLLFLSCEEVSILWIFISLKLSCKPSNSNNFTWLTLPQCHFWNSDSHWQYFTSPQSQPAFPSAHLLGCFVSMSTLDFPSALPWIFCPLLPC